MSEIMDLTAILNDAGQSGYKRRDAFNKLTRLNPPELVGLLCPLLQDRDRYIKQDTVRYLSERGGAAAVPALLEVLSDSDQSVRGYAIAGLGKWGDRSILKQLTPILEDRSYSVRSAVKDAISKLGGPEPAAEVEDNVEDVGSGEAVESYEAAEEVIEEIEVPVESLIQPMEPTEGTKAPGIEPPPIPAEVEFEEDTPEPSPVPEEPEDAVEPPPPPAEVKEETLEPPPISEDVARDEPPPLPGEPIEPPVPAVLGMSSVLVSDNVHWTGAKRMQAFWDGDLELVKKLYATYWKCRQKLPEQETIASDALNELKLLHADQDDDLAEYAQEVDELKKGINKSKRASEKWEKRERKLVEKQNSGLTTLLNPIFNTREEVELELKQVRRDDKRENEKLVEQEKRLKTIQKDHDALALRLRTLEEKTRLCRQDTGEAVKAVQRADRAINQAIEDHLLTKKDDDLAAIFVELTEGRTDRDFLRFCCKELSRELIELKKNRELLSLTQKLATHVKETCGRSMDEVGREVASGFVLNEQVKELKIKLNGSLYFKEESGLWSGYSNASGSAIGQGHAKGKYSQQQVAWHPGEHFDTTVDRVAGHWCDLGEVSGKLEFLQAMVLAGEQAIHEYIHFVRTELERDFEEA